MALPCQWTCHHPSSFQVLLCGTFPGSGSGLTGCGTVFMVRDPIMVHGAVPSWHFMNPVTLFFLFLQVRTQGMSGSSQLSEESWLCSACSADCGLLASANSVVCFSSNHQLFLVGPPCFSAAFFLLAYCLPPTLCSLLWDIAHWTALNDRPHFLATSLMFLALLTM